MQQTTISQSKAAPSKPKSTKKPQRSFLLNPEQVPAQGALAETLQLPPLQANVLMASNMQQRAGREMPRSRSKRSMNTKENRGSPRRPPVYPLTRMPQANSFLLQTPPPSQSRKMPTPAAGEPQKSTLRTPQLASTSKISPQ